MTHPQIPLPTGHLTGGRTTWAAALTSDLSGATCLWQDLDGLHVETPPAVAPPTTVLWGWTDNGTLLRLRIDNETVFVARCDKTAGVTTLPWSPTDNRVAAYRGPAATQGGLGASYVEVTVHGDAEHPPITFVYPLNV
jgi:hypothetical protein